MTQKPGRDSIEKLKGVVRNSVRDLLMKAPNTTAHSIAERITDLYAPRLKGHSPICGDLCRAFVNALAKSLYCEENPDSFYAQEQENADRLRGETAQAEKELRQCFEKNPGEKLSWETHWGKEIS